MGGRSPRGIDCSGLVQVAHGLCGIATPRDSDQQRALGRPLPQHETLHRGDLLFFEGHVGMMVDARDLIHATGHHGRTLIEPLETIAGRTPILDRRRLS
jgi:cell wall-associated NlpC family hydrolase